MREPASPFQEGAARPAGSAAGSVAWILRAEGLAVALAAVVAYRLAGGSLGFFLVTVLLPDLTLLAYLSGPRVGATAYNLGHTYVLPAALAVAGWATAFPELMLLAAVWTFHIGVDRVLGYGLKYGDGFGHTHLGPIGPGRAPH